MLFNSYTFLFCFFPLVLGGWFLLGRQHPSIAKTWLGLASLVFYGAWNWHYVPLLLATIAFNFFAASIISPKSKEQILASHRLNILRIAIVTNLLTLGYYKYSNFFALNMNTWLGMSLPAPDIVLPLGISFYTFTQIAYLVDAYRYGSDERSWHDYLLFVTYFPHQIAGPILHHKQILPQIQDRSTFRLRATNLAAGLTLLTIGLAKKVLVADELAGPSDSIFAAASAGQPLMVVESWLGALSYTLQLYFDFSGYSDMAIGLSLMLNIRLPANFNSPYKATSIIDFWRRWHITLSTFLKDYLYLPLGGNRKGYVRRHANLLATMVLGGLWHGAAWTFLVWGGIHGLFLILNHGWRHARAKLGWSASNSRLSRLLAGGLTFSCVVVGWVIFRSDSLHACGHLLASMAGLQGLSLPISWQTLWPNWARELLDVQFLGLLPVTQTSTATALSNLAIGFSIVWLLPNAQEFLQAYRPTYEEPHAPAGMNYATCASSLQWRPTWTYGLALGTLFAYALLSFVKGTPFLYFQF